MKTERRRGPITRPSAGTSVGLMVASATITVLITRFYLFVTGYPQVGGEIFHIAHAVWGGLLLMIGLFIALAMANRWSALVGGLVGGIGAGLFVDEVGKFITKDNDYFFPLAAPIAYGVLIAFAFAAYMVGRGTRDTSRAHLYAALELMKPALDGPMTQRQLNRVREHVATARDMECDDRTTAIIEGLEHALDEAGRDVDHSPSGATGVIDRLERWEQRFFPTERVRAVCRVGLGVLAVAGLIGGPGVLALSLWNLFGPNSLTGNNSMLGGDPGQVAWIAAAVASVTGLIAGILAFRAVRRLGANSDRWRSGVQSGLAALGLMLVGVNFLSSYFDQFLVLLDASAQATVFAMLARFGRRVGVLNTDDLSSQGSGSG